MSDYLDTFNRYIQCQIQQSQVQAAPKPKRDPVRPFVTISRQAGAGGTTIGRLLIAYLLEHDKKAKVPWTIFDRTLVDQVLKEHHLPKQTEKYMPEKKISEINDIVETMFELHPPAFALVRDTSETILHLAQMGYCVIVGRGANIVTRQLFGGIHVRLIGSYEKRLQNFQEFYQLEESEAVKKIKEEESGRSGYVKQNFERDIDDPSIYDLVINTDRISHERAAQIIGDEVLLKAKQEPE